MRQQLANIQISSLGSLGSQEIRIGNALRGRDATRSLLRYLRAAITERRAGDGRTVPARLSM